MNNPDLVDGEVLKPQIDVVRWSERDEDPEAEEYYDLGSVGFDFFKGFMQSLRERYPDQWYPDDTVIDRINPRLNTLAEMRSRNPITYLAFDGENVVGAAIGKDEGETLEGQWIVVDPKYRGRETVKKLLAAIEQDFDRVTLIARSFSESRNASPEERIRQQQKLVHYYQRLGFEIDKDSKTYRYSHLPRAPVPMVWQKK